MIVAINIVLLILAAMIGVPAFVLFIECVASLFARKPVSGETLELPGRIGILISAHNEEVLIASTVRSIVAQLRPGCDRLLVVADNCTDATAALARQAGGECVTVIERNDLTRRGKGFGLSFGVEHLRNTASTPDVLILFDADIQVPTGVVARLAHEAARRPRPIQAQYIQQAPPSAGPRGTVSTLAFIVKNAVRPAGLDRLGVPCALTGSGMAFQWPLIEKAPLASGHLVEDMELGLHFLREGCGPMYCGSAVIVGELPGDSRTAYVQRTRWEHGHLGIIRANALPLLLGGMRRARFDMIATAFDLAVPPLALLAGLWFVGAMAALAFGWLGHVWAPAMFFGASGAMIFIGVILGWAQHARRLPITALLAVPLYVFWKVPLYCKFVFRRQTTWVRTARAPVTDGVGVS